MSVLLDQRIIRVLPFLVGLALSIEGCGPDQSSAAVASSAQAQMPPAPSNAALRLETTSTGNQARYRVREQLVNVDWRRNVVTRPGLDAAEQTISVRFLPIWMSSFFFVCESQGHRALRTQA